MHSETVGKVECPECKSSGTAIEYITKIEGDKYQEEYSISNKYTTIDKPVILLFKCNNCSNLFIMDVTD